MHLSCPGRNCNPIQVTVHPQRQKWYIRNIGKYSWYVLFFPEYQSKSLNKPHTDKKWAAGLNDILHAEYIKWYHCRNTVQYSKSRNCWRLQSAKARCRCEKAEKVCCGRINVSRRSSKSNIHKITRIISTAGVYPLIKKALDNILGCRFIISFPCNQIKSNLAEQKLYHNMGKMSRDRTC